MSDDTRHMLADQVRAQRESWTTALDHVDEHAGDPEHFENCATCEELGLDEDAGRLDVLNTEALSVETAWTGSNRADAVVTETTIVLCTGGPHVEIVTTIGRDHSEIVGYWGGETVREYLDHAPTVDLAHELAEWAEES